MFGWHGATPVNAIDWMERIIGWLLTIMAISVAAPFWFDLLSRFMNLRNAAPVSRSADNRSESLTQSALL